MDDAMRDILSKLDTLLSEAPTLDDLKKMPAAEDPVIAKAIADKEEEQETDEDIYQVGDEFGISFSEDFEISATITDILEDGIVIELDDQAMEMMTNEGLSFTDIQIDEEKQKGVDGKACWKGYKRMGTKQKGGKTVDNCVKMGENFEISEKAPPGAKAERMVKHIKKGYADDGKLTDKEKSIAYATAWKHHNKKNEDSVAEAEYQGRKVPLGKPMAGDVKKSKVYVKNPQGNVVKVNFGDKKMRIKKSNPNRRKSFRARHNCANPGPRHKARYWSCRAW
jgi:hypothetical protein